MDYQPAPDEIFEELKPWLGEGRVADDIPRLASSQKSKLGMAVQTVGGESLCVGDAVQLFSIQSISTICLLTVALELFATKTGNSIFWLAPTDGGSDSPFCAARVLELTCVIFLKAQRKP